MASKKRELAELNDEQVEKNNADRRNLRAAQRLIMDIIAVKGEEAVNIETDTFDQLRQKTNLVFDERERIQAHVTREHHNDAVLMRELSHIVRKQAATLQSVSRLYSFERFASCIRRDFQNPASPIGIDWVALGDDVGSFFLPQAELDTMLGPMSKEKKVRIAAARKSKQHYDEVNPDTIINTNEDGNCDEATNERYKKLLDISERMSSSKGKGGDPDRTYNLMCLLANRKDNVQTVENLFDFAFAIKDKRAMMSYQMDPECSTKMPHAIHHELDATSVAENAQKKQMVLSVKMAELTELRQLLVAADALGLSKEAALEARALHRRDPIYNRQLSAREQANLIEDRGRAKDEAALQAHSGSKGTSSSSSSKRPRTAPSQ